MTNTPTTTGLTGFDTTAGPIPRGRLTIAAGRHSAGTSALAYTVTRHNLTAGRTVGFVPLEVTPREVTRSLMAGVAAVNLNRREKLSERDFAQVQEAAASLKNGDLRFLEPNYGADDFCGDLAKALDNAPSLDLLVIDHLDLAVYQEETPGATARGVAELARERNVAVLATEHLRRRGNDTIPPSIGDFRRPAVEETADAVILIHRPDLGGKAPDRRGEVDLLPARGWAASETVTARFEPEYHRLVDVL